MDGPAADLRLCDRAPRGRDRGRHRRDRPRLQPGYFPGWHPGVHAFRAWVEPEQEIGPQLEGLGIQPGDVREVVASEPPREFAIRPTAGPIPFLYRYQFSTEIGETVMKLNAEVELPRGAAALPQLASRLVKKGVNDNLATLKLILEAARP